MVGARLATAAGLLLGGMFFVIAKLRGGRKALHPDGTVHRGLLRRHGSSVATGVSWIDEPGEDDVTVRLSRSVGLPQPLPDILGVAVQVPTAPGHGDLLLAGTGTGRLGRFLPHPRRRYDTGAYCSFFPYRTPSGPLLLGAMAAEPAGAFQLAWARLTGTWHVFGTLELAPDPGAGRDGELSFDPVLHEVPGLHSYRWAAQLRRFAYAASRRARSSS